MIIFGIRSTTGTPIETQENCPACGKEHCIYMVPNQEYFHIFWIPMLPLTRSFTPVCSECSGVFTKDKIPATHHISRQYKTPKWTFFGLIAILIFTTYFLTTRYFSTKALKKEMVEKIESPQLNDVYHIKLAPLEYSLMKIVAFTEDSIYFAESAYTVDRKNGMSKVLDKNEYYEDEEDIFGLSKEELKDQVPTLDIFQIDRQ